MTRSWDYVLLRVFEVALGAAVVIAVVVTMNSGWLTSNAQKFADWYASEVDGILAITVVSTAVTLPQVQRADLPIPPPETPELAAPRDDAIVAEGSIAPGVEASPLAPVGADTD